MGTYGIAVGRLFRKTRPFGNGYFSDGTEVLIQEANYEWQNGKLYFNYITYMKIAK